MANLAFFTDRNEIANPPDQNPCTITSNTGWLPTAPLDVLKTTPLYDAAVSDRIGTEADPVEIIWSWEFPVDLIYAGLIDTNLAQNSTGELDGWFDVDMTQNVVSLRRNPVPSLTDPGAMRFGIPNQFRGDIDPRDYLKFVKNLHFVSDLCRVRKLRLRLWGAALRPDGSADTAYKVGLAWAGDGLLFSRHVGASGESHRPGDQVIRSDDGSVWVEPGIGRRCVVIDRQVTDKKLRDILFIMAARAGRRNPYIYLPNIIDLAECWQYGGMFRRTEDEHVHKYNSPMYTTGTIDLMEWRE